MYLNRDGATTGAGPGLPALATEGSGGGGTSSGRPPPAGALDEAAAKAAAPRRWSGGLSNQADAPGCRVDPLAMSCSILTSRVLFSGAFLACGRAITSSRRAATAAFFGTHCSSTLPTLRLLGGGGGDGFLPFAADLGVDGGVEWYLPHNCLRMIRSESAAPSAAPTYLI